MRKLLVMLAMVCGCGIDTAERTGGADCGPMPKIASAFARQVSDAETPTVLITWDQWIAHEVSVGALIAWSRCMSAD